MQHYIEYTLPDLIQTALNQHRIETHSAAVGKYCRHRFVICLGSLRYSVCPLADSGTEVRLHLANTSVEE